MSDMQASVTKTDNGFSVAGYEKLNYDFAFVEGVFDIKNKQLAECYQKWGRVLTVLDENMKALYADEIKKYFDHYNIPVTFHAMAVGEKAKSIETLLKIVESMTNFGIIRKEPVLVVGGGLVTDVAGFACACYRRTTNFIRVPTTLIGLIDASVSIKVAVNYGNYKNRLGAYHAPIWTFLDFSFLKTLPIAQVRNGFAEIIKISSCADLKTFNSLDRYCEELIDTKFGRLEGSRPEVRKVADEICYDAIYEMLKLETPNLHEIMLDRVIAYGHTWSPFHELQPEPPLRHGHAISIDMAYTATLAYDRGMLSKEDHTRILTLFSRAGLSIDHQLYDDVAIEKGTEAILKTRDGALRLAVPSPLGQCQFVNEFSVGDLQRVLKDHKKYTAGFPRSGDGLEAYVDASDTGEPTVVSPKNLGKGQPNGSANGHSNGMSSKIPNGHKALVQDAHHENGDLMNESKLLQPVQA
ncbi:Dehydroquinate synthase-like protein [Pseudovirgaria hyperparasitica]|uniref:Dehydroquinate synthase-like protein n=1 Tax=Pseudovirgaria hyperparasitica TaxID=470096 RepID=A0A6A6WIZ5_9PEZI|nr:Dehydroquinate synthase-like protein [Pseudovirgaria hyperparasitica]KAF2761687.1 Dehydroquinate synthase-like protein [Pseudovirgaria hyperparasitica]